MLSDHPITTAGDDLLGRAEFSRQVASAMLACPSDKRGSFAIGLCGGWGSGKTSILNMVAEALRNGGRAPKAGKPPKPAPVIVQFNPWLYPAEELLAGQYLHILAAELKRPSHGEKLNKAAKAVEKYAAALRCGAEDKSTPVMAETVAELNGNPKPGPRPGPVKQKPPKGVLEQKEKVCRLLQKQKQKIYIMIDDIDRLSPRRIRHVLQLIGAVAGFPRMVYLLSFDQQVVARALGRELDADGFEYLKKFVQVQFTVPAADSGRIHEILSLYVETWRKAQADLNFDPAYFDTISPFLYSCMASIRDVYRFVNTFRFQYQALGNEVNFVDLMAVTALQLHVPQALPWMQAHRDDLLRGGGLAFQSASPAYKQRMRREHEQALTAMSDPGDKTLLPMIGHMFPRYGRDVLERRGEEPDARPVRMRRICCEEFFDLYFSLSTEGLAITRKEILASVRAKNAAALRAFTDGITAFERRNAYIGQLPYYLEDIPADKLPVFFAETLWLSRLPEDPSPSPKPFQRSYFQACVACALRLLARMREPARTRCLRDAAAQADERTLPMLVVVLTRIQSHSPDACSMEIGDEAMERCRQLMLPKINAFAKDGNWLAQPRPLPVLEFWQQAEPETFAPYFAALLRDDANAARLISCLTLRFDQGANMEYQFGDMRGRHAFSEALTRADALAALERLRGTAAFAALPEEVRLDCVAFSLMEEGGGRVAHQAVGSWRRTRDGYR